MLASIVLVRFSMKSKLFLRTEDMAIASCFAKVSKPACDLVFWTLWNSWWRDLPLVVIPTYWSIVQK